MEVQVAVNQKPPVLLQRNATIAKAVEAVDEAVDAGAPGRGAIRLTSRSPNGCE